MSIQRGFVKLHRARLKLEPSSWCFYSYGILVSRNSRVVSMRWALFCILGASEPTEASHLCPSFSGVKRGTERKKYVHYMVC